METFSALLAICAGNSPVPVNSPHKGQWRWALMFSLICAWINGWVNNREAGDLRRYRVHYDVIVMWYVGGRDGDINRTYITWYTCIKRHVAPYIETYWIVIYRDPMHFDIKCNITMMTSSNGSIFRVTGHLCREFTGPRWIPHTKASDAGLWCFLWAAPE